MSLTRRNRKPRPLQPWEEIAKEAKFPKAHLIAGKATSPEIDTRDLPHRKIHPDRDEAYKRWLVFQPCAVRGLTDDTTGQVHVCWSPTTVNGRPASDPAHAGKSYSGALKRNDSECMPLCRHAHRLQEDRMNAFDERFGIDRFAVAREHRARFLAEQEKRL